MRYIYNSILCIVLTVIAIGIFMYISGAVNYNRIAECTRAQKNTFCGLERIDLAIPEYLLEDILSEVEEGKGTRIEMNGWKSGRTITTTHIKQNLPNVYDWYIGLEETISKHIGERVYATSDTLPTTCALLIYEKDGDFINWHYDVNYFDGRFFTLLVPCTIVNTCTKYTYYNKEGEIVGIPEEEGKSILFEGDKVFHMATKFCNRGKKRIVLSLQFSTNPNINLINRGIMRIKDIAYIGI